MIWKAYYDDKTCFKNHFVPKYGKITPEDVWRYAAPRATTGDSQVIVMDYDKYSGIEILGIGFLIISLAVGYFFLKKALHNYSGAQKHD